MSGSSTNVAQSLGIVTLIWGGKTINVDSKSSTFMPGGQIADAVINGNQVSYSYKLVQASVKASFALLKGMSLATLKGLNGSELQVQCDTGQSYTIGEAVMTKDMSVKGGSGNNVSCEWSGQPAAEVVS